MDKCRSILSIDDLRDDEIGRLFYAARTIKTEFCAREKKHRHAVMMTAFFEPSTRTRLSFEMAALRLGLGVTTFVATSSSMAKGESVFETLTNLIGLGPDILVVRNLEPWMHEDLVHSNVAIINGGDGANEHPSQALLDCFTLLNHFKSDNLVGKKILIIGDLAHSRVAHSNIKLMLRLGAELTLLAPDAFQLHGQHGNVRSCAHFDDVDDAYDAVMCLRMQKERMAQGFGITDEDYRARYGLHRARLLRLGKNCVVLHPGPMNLFVEIERDVAYGPQSLIAEQVKNGVLMRAALIDHCLS